jgi:hypothetical protein
VAYGINGRTDIFKGGKRNELKNLLHMDFYRPEIKKN